MCLHKGRVSSNSKCINQSHAKGSSGKAATSVSIPCGEQLMQNHVFMILSRECVIVKLHIFCSEQLFSAELHAFHYLNRAA